VQPMKQRRPSDLMDYWDIFLRRRWSILLTFVLITGTTLGVTLKLPKIYRSETLILVEPQELPPEYVKPTVGTDITDPLATIRQQILSRTRLQRIIDQFGLYGDQREHCTQEEIVELMRKDINIETILGGRFGERVGAIKIFYQGRNPVLVQQVNRQIASLFIEDNLQVREQQAEGTTEFITSELEKARQDLETQEKRLEDFKARANGTLPEQQTANLQAAGQLQLSLQVNLDALARAQERKSYLESLLNAVAKRGTVPPESPLKAQLDARRAELAAAERLYKPEHPDVARLRSQVKALEKQVEQSDKEEPTAASDSPDQLHDQIAALDKEIKEYTRRQSEIEKKIKVLEARVEVLPSVEQELSEINRDYEISKANYQSLLKKKNDSAMAAELERRAKGKPFRIVDPASYPEKPYRPNVMVLGALGGFAGILCGCAVGMFLEYKDPSIYSEKDAALHLPLPVLASLPLIIPQRRRNNVVHINNKPKGATVLSGLGGNNTAAIVANQRLVIRLDQLPEKLVVRPPRLSAPTNFLALEKFLVVRARLLELIRAGKMRTLVVTSAVEGEGKTFVAANLAFALSQVERLRVLLVDADLRKGSLARFFGINPHLGLSNYLRNGKRLGEVRWEVNGNLAVVPTLSLSEGCAELVEGSRMQSFMREALADHDLVILDAPPLLPVVDAQRLTSMVDAALMVVRAGYCPSELARQVADRLQTKAIGLVLNAVQRMPYNRYYYGYYGYSRKPDKTKWA
jgi:polysaccharide chain length determinant protein (PEP-CTERM system associated)